MSKKTRKPKKASKRVKPKKVKPRKKPVVKRVRSRGKSLLLEEAISNLEGELDSLQQRKRELNRHITSLKRAVNTLHSRGESLRGELFKVKSNEKLSKKKAVISSTELEEIKERILKLCDMDKQLKKMR
jgi:chromosome segregation ATPase